MALKDYKLDKGRPSYGVFICVMVDKGFLFHFTRLSEKDGF